MLAPCLYIKNESAEGKAEDITMEAYDVTVRVLDAEKVNVFAGSNATADQNKVCSPSSTDAYLADQREYACALYKSMSAFDGIPLKGLPVKSFKQFYQVAISNRFQQFVEDFNKETIEQPLLEPGIGEASLPIRLVVLPKDLTCTLTQAHRIAKEYGGESNVTEVGTEAGHAYFAFALQQPDLLAMLRDELTNTDFSSALADPAASSDIFDTITEL